MMRSESRSVLLTEFQEGSEETEILMELEEFLFSPKSQQQNYFKLLLLPNRENTNTANSSECCHAKYIHLYSTSSTTVPVKRVAAKSGREPEKKQCSLASRVTEWHFYDVSQIIPWDGWAELEHQLINPSTDGMCCGHPLLSCSFPGRSIQPDMLERMTNECGYRRHNSVCVCVTRTLAHVWLVD